MEFHQASIAPPLADAYEILLILEGGFYALWVAWAYLSGLVKHS